MKVCSDRQETFWLDLYGELDPKEQLAWDQHLRSCAGCREERGRMHHLLARIKEEMAPPQLSLERASALSWSIKRKLRHEELRAGWWKRIVATPKRMIPAVAAASLLIVAFGWFSAKIFQSPTMVQDASSGRQVTATDLEVINNLELLEELDTLQKLVQVLDDKETM
ncbi:MAG: hypothetical protein PVG99_13460 [Desulfobacteraceae bacterium]|jgi:hypothetical protein